MTLRQQPQPQVLGDVGVLVLVDQNVAELLLVVIGDFSIVAEQGQHVQQQIAEIAGVERAQPLLVIVIEGQCQPVDGVGALGGGNAIGREPAILPALHDAREQARRQLLGVDLAGLGQLLDQPQLVIGIKDAEAGLQADQLGMAAQHPCADGMESPHPPAFD